MSSAYLRRACFRGALCVALSLNFLLGTAPTRLPAASETDELLGLCRVDTLPKDVRNSLTRNFSAWKVQDVSDLSVRARTRWGEQRPLTCPGIAAGHFQDPKNDSYALLLVPTNRDSHAYRLLVYTQQTERYYGFKTVGEADASANDVFIASVPTARFFEATSKWVAHSHVPEAVMLVDSASSQSYLYIWSDLAYEREQVNYQ